MAKKKRRNKKGAREPFLEIGGSAGDANQYFLAGFAAFLLLLWMMPYWTGMSFTDYLYAKLDFLTIPVASAEAGEGDAGESAYVSLFEALDEEMITMAVTPRLTAVAGAQIESAGSETADEEAEGYYIATGRLSNFVSGSVIDPLKLATSQVFAGVVPNVPEGMLSIAAVGDAAYDVFDVSEQVEPWVEVVRPPVSAVWNAWLELMADPF